MAQNLFSFNPFSGVTAGIQLITDGVSSTGRVLPDHVMIGNCGFIQVEKNWRNVPLAAGKRLFDASLKLITPNKGSSFEVLAPRGPHFDKLYCFVDSIIPAGMKLQAEPEEVNAHVQEVVSGEARLVMFDRFCGSYFLEFSDENDEVEIWYQNGHIARLVRRGDQVVSVPLSVQEIAQKQEWQLRSCISELDSNRGYDVRRLHGILGSAIRLLRAARDRSVQDIYVDLLVDEIGNMTDRLRTEARNVLLSLGHPSAGNFADDWGINVVPLCGKKNIPAEAKAKRAKRAARDREVRERMREGGKK